MSALGSAATRRLSRLRMLPGAVGATLRRLRDEPGVAVTVAVLVTVTAAVVAAVPRHLTGLEDRGLRETVAAAPVVSRDILVVQRTTIDPGPPGTPLASVDAVGDQLADALPDALAQVVADRTTLAESVLYFVPNRVEGQDVDFLRDLILRVHVGVADHVTVTDGRLPARSNEVVEVREGLGGVPGRQVPVLEVALSDATMTEMELAVGDELLIQPNPQSARATLFATHRSTAMRVRVVGAFTVDDAEDPYWAGDTRVAEPPVYPDSGRGLVEVKHVEAYGVVAEEAYGELMSATSPLPYQYTWRYAVDLDRLSAGSVPALAADVRQLDNRFGRAGRGSGEAVVQTGLSGVLDRYVEQRDLATTVLAIAAIGLVAVALTVVWLAAALAAARRRDTVELVRSRGASTGQVLTAHLTEGALLAVPTAIVGALAARALITGGAGTVSAALAAAIAVAAVGLLVAAVWPTARRALTVRDRDEVADTTVSPRRVVVEVLVVVLAVVGVWLVRRRGLDRGGVDLYLTAVPVLLGLAAGLLTLRLSPIPIRALAWWAARRRDLVPVLALRRAARHPGATGPATLVLVLTVAVATYASVVETSIDRGQTATAWDQAGADVRVDARPGGALHSGFDLSAVDGVQDVAPAHVDAEQRDLVSRSTTPITFVAVDTEALARVTAGTPADVDLPAAVRQPVSGGSVGTAAEPIPALVSEVWVRDRRLRPGDTLSLDVDGTSVTFLVHATAADIPAVDDGRPFLLASLDSVQAVGPGPALRPNRAYVRTDGSADGAIRQVVRDQLGGGAVTVQDELLAARRDAAFVSGTVVGFRAALVLAGAYATLAVVLALTLTSRARARDLAYLRTQGLSARQTLALTLVEFTPPVAIAGAVGLFLGVVIARVTAPGVDLRAFTGSTSPVVLQGDARDLALLLATLAGIVAVAVVVVAALAARSDLARALRMGDR